MKLLGYRVTRLVVCASVAVQVALVGCVAPPRRLSPAQVSTLSPSTSNTQVLATPSSAQLMVKTDHGELEGMVEGGVVAFKGIPYAAPPVGDLRWREPQPNAVWDGVRKADVFGKPCIQDESIAIKNDSDPGPSSEDCLFLNVWTPGADPTVKRPVMVWIHGGAYMLGTGNSMLYSGGPLARKGAVVVTLNYRLGQLGFFAHPALEKESPAGPINFGLFDQIAALKWVQQNIAAFGGDPGNVTIFGQSAGGKSVLALFASPLARGLFHKGIAESSYAVPEATRTKALEAGTKVADALGLNGVDATIAELRAVPAEKFAQVKGAGTSFSPVPAVGDAVLPQTIQETFAKGEEAPVPLILGNTSNDASVIEQYQINPTAVLQQLGVAGIVVKALYPGVTDDTQLTFEAMRDLAFTMPARWLADRHSKLAPSWRYYFSYVPVNYRAKQPYGVPHAGEIVFTMNTGDLSKKIKANFTDADWEMSQRVSDYWFEFARIGVPLSNGSPEWPNHNTKQDKTMEFGETIAVQTNFMKPRLDVFIGILNILGRVLGRE